MALLFTLSTRVRTHDGALLWVPHTQTGSLEYAKHLSVQMRLGGERVVLLTAAVTKQRLPFMTPAEATWRRAEIRRKRGCTSPMKRCTCAVCSWR